MGVLSELAHSLASAFTAGCIRSDQLTQFEFLCLGSASFGLNITSDELEPSPDQVDQLAAALLMSESHQAGLIAVLEFAISAQHIPLLKKLVAYGIKLLQLLPSNTSSSMDVEGPFLRDVTVAILEYAAAVPETQESITNKVWDALLSLPELNSGAPLALIDGICMSLPRLHSKEAGKLLKLSQKHSELVKDDYIAARALYQLAYHVLSGVFDFSKSRNTSNDIWEAVLIGQVSDRGGKLDATTFNVLSHILWPSGWLQADSEDDGEFVELAVKSGTMCAILSHDFANELVADLMASIESQSTLVTLDTVGPLIAMIEALGVISLQKPKLFSDIKDFLVQIVVNPSWIEFAGSDLVAIDCLRNCSIEILITSIKYQTDASLVSGASKSALFSFINALQIPVPETSEKFICEAWHSNCIAAATRLVSLLKPKQALEIVVPALSRRLQESPSDDFRAFLWESLMQVATGSEQGFEEIFSLFSATSVIPKLQIPSSLKHSSKFTGPFSKGILSLFIERAVVAQNATKTNEGLVRLAWLLKTICDEETFEFSTASEVQYLLRNFWILVSLHVFELSLGWPKDWTPILTSIASKTPPLLLAKEKRNLEADLVSNSILRVKLADSYGANARLYLLSVVPGLSAELKGMSTTLLIYFVTLLQLETFRVRTSSLKHMLQYLKDERFYNSTFYPLLELLGSEVAKSYLGVTQIRQSSLRESLSALIAGASHRLPRVRSFSSKCALRIWEAVPSLLWDKKTVCDLLNLALYLETYGTGNRIELLTSKLSTHSLQFLDDTERTEACTEFSRFAEKALTLAHKRSSEESVSLIQIYLMDLHIREPELSLADDLETFNLLSKFCQLKEVALSIVRFLQGRAQHIGELRGFEMSTPTEVLETVKRDLKSLASKANSPSFIRWANPIMSRAAALVVSQPDVNIELLHLICWSPLLSFNKASMDMATPVWNWILTLRPDLSSRMFADFLSLWEWSVDHQKGLYSSVTLPHKDAFMEKMTFTPSIPIVTAENSAVVHLKWAKFMLGRFKLCIWHNKEHLFTMANFVQVALKNLDVSKDPSPAHISSLSLLVICGEMAVMLERMSEELSLLAWQHVLEKSLDYFAQSPSWGTNLKEEIELLASFRAALKYYHHELKPGKVFTLSLSQLASKRVPSNEILRLCLSLVDNELIRRKIWANTLVSHIDSKMEMDPMSQLMLALSFHPALAGSIMIRYTELAEALVKDGTLSRTLFPTKSYQVSSLLSLFQSVKRTKGDMSLRMLLYWTPMTPVIAISLLTAKSDLEPWLLQYAMRSLEHFPAEQVFFYIPQVVQSLRNDDYGYVERYLLETARASQLFAHQMIWNMNANMFYMFKEKGEIKMVEDEIKPILDRNVEKIVSNITGSDKTFYEREFQFFSEITGISGKLKPYIKRSKAEKKQKIDEEIRNIAVEVGVYLPSNPESTLLDIDYDSGRPLQSHAKAPFMATFKIERSVDGVSATKEVVWQSAIFKVGDDCRQDVLTLQLISNIKSICHKAGLNVYLFPYRVVATAPGCGVLEFVPRTISRDQIGREKVNSLPDYFLEKYGTVDSLAFRKAQNAFIESLAAYSLCTYLFQIKDRNNGNILFDDQGHIIHIDFGFILDISPGGIEFEASPFKFTTEMIDILGGSADTPAYRRFSELTIKGFLAVRPYAKEIVTMVTLMMHSGLPCFKGEKTIEKLWKKFQLNKTDAEAAEYMLAQIRAAHENQFTRLYDRFQNFQSGTPF